MMVEVGAVRGAAASKVASGWAGAAGSVAVPVAETVAAVGAGVEAAQGVARVVVERAWLPLSCC
jgi:hypothetical protein